ncbi:MAG: hypothetical protein QOJ19_2640 [Acidimicrobiia bacterium]|nr:hypothetical protein [Acidimicrobiia bacterium]
MYASLAPSMWRWRPGSSIGDVMSMLGSASWKDVRGQTARQLPGDGQRLDDREHVVDTGACIERQSMPLARILPESHWT